MIKSLCATLLLLCSSFGSNFDFEYSNQDEFIKGITECTVQYNAALPPQYRSIVVISAAQAILESDWGNSRFAKLGNNFYGMIETDRGEPHIKALESNILLKKYGRKCESVADYIGLLNTGTDFKEYREVRLKETVSREINLDTIIDTLHTFAIDPNYTKKIKITVDYLLREYPEIFLLVEGQNV